MTHHIVIPIHHGGGKLNNDTELRFCLRSIEMHLKGDYDITIIAKKLPKWAKGLKLIKHNGGLKSAVVKAANEYPEGFTWMYDDCCLLKDMSTESLKVTPCSKKWQKSGTRWGEKLMAVKDALDSAGIKAWDYSRPHGPYFFDKSMIDESFVDWKGMSGKFPFESWILSKRNWPRRHGAVRQYYGIFRGSPDEGSWWFLNYNDKGNTPPLRNWLRRRFPKQSKYEHDPEMSKKEIYYKQSRHLHNAWLDLGSPTIRTACECAVGAWSLLQRFEGSVARGIFIEPDPDMARDARKNYPWAEVFELAIADTNGRANLRKLHGSSYIKGIRWSPIFKANPNRARKAGKVSVRTVRFDSLDDGKIDVLNLDCEGSEWFVLSNMKSRPFLLQIELYAENGYYNEITKWLVDNEYELVSTWGNANFIYKRVKSIPE